VDFLLLLESIAPSRLGDCWRRWQEKDIILGHLRLIVRGSCAFLGGVPKATLLHYACHSVTSLESGVLQCLAGLKGRDGRL
jgi:hypothetical protein